MMHVNMLRIALALPALLAAPAAARATPQNGGNIAGTITDRATSQPLSSAEIGVSRAGRIVAHALTDSVGRYRMGDIAAGTYLVLARHIGYRPESLSVTIAPGATAQASFSMVAVPRELGAVQVTGSAPPVAVNTRTGDQVFQQQDYHGAPTNTTSQILQQSIAGAVRAPTGEVHIRGQHAEYTYYVDGVPVPSGISGSLNEIFDPSVVQNIDFQTGGWDAEYGDKNAAVINVTTKIPAGGFHADLSTYAGSFAANGQTLNLSSNTGPWGFFASGTRQATDMRQEPIIANPATNAPVNFHNSGDDLFGFGRVQYAPSVRDTVDLDVNWSRTHLEVPYDSSGGVRLDDHQQDANGFVNLGWNHRFGDSTESTSPAELFAAAFYRNGSLRYIPGASDQPSFVFFPETTAFNLSEDRSFSTYGVKLDYAFRPSHLIAFKTGTLSSITTGHENFQTADALGRSGPASVSGLSGHDAGLYAQTVITPGASWELRTGGRYDSHVAPFAGDQHQVSPRVKLSYFPSSTTTLYAYYGRLFIPTNVEDLRAITSVADSGVATAPTLPERDQFFEVGVVHRFPLGITGKLSAYHKRSSPGIDDNTVPGSAIVTSVNIAQVHVTGIESVLEVRPGGPVSGYVNLALNHAYGRGPITGGFFPEATPPAYFDLDHDQRISAVASMTYSPSRFFVSATGIFGTGLTNGVTPDPSQPSYASYGTGLFDFNRLFKVAPSFIMNASTGYALTVGGTVVRPELYVENLFDRKYLLKGSFFSGASVGRPRSVEFRINVGL